MKADVDLTQTSTQRRITRPTAWKLALLAGFVTQLLLIVLVTPFGLRQLVMTTDKLNAVVDVYMRKQNLTKDMVIAARERTLVMFMLTKIEDPFERDELLMQFNNKGSVFVTARQALMNMPLNQREQNLIARQGQLVRYAQPIQEQVIDQISRGAIRDAEDLILSKVIPAQNDVLEMLSQLDTQTQQVALPPAARRMKWRVSGRSAKPWWASCSSTLTGSRFTTRL